MNAPTRADIVWSYLHPAEILHLADGTWTAADLRGNVCPGGFGRGSAGAYGLHYNTVAAGCAWHVNDGATRTHEGLMTWAQMRNTVRASATPALVAALADVHAQVLACCPDMYWHPLSLEELADTVRAERKRRATDLYYRLQPAYRRAAHAIVFAPVQLDLLAAA